MTYSIIIPHKDIPSLLNRLLLSIPKREDIEILVVDNSNQELKKEGLDRVENVTILYSNKTKGAGCARNVGLKRALGEWIIFADADDFFTEKAFDIFDKYKESNSDIIYYGVESKKSDTLEKGNRANYYMQLIADYINNATEKNSLKLRYGHFVPWGKMMSRKLIVQNKLRFEEVAASNDIMFSAKAGYCAKTIDVSDSVVYCVTERENSLTGSKSKKNMFCRFRVNYRQNKFLKKIGMASYQLDVSWRIYEAKQFGKIEYLKYILYSVLCMGDFRFIKPHIIQCRYSKKQK